MATLATLVCLRNDAVALLESSHALADFLNLAGDIFLQIKSIRTHQKPA